MSSYYCLFKRFFKTGMLLLGGGYVILPLLKEEIAQKFDGITDDDICEYYSISQCLPGLIAINTAGFVGYKLMGIRGAICAVTGLVMPAFLAIILLAELFLNVADNDVVKSIFAGVGLGVITLVFQAINEVMEKSVTDKFSFIVFLCAFTALIGFKISPVYVVITGLIFGIILGLWRVER